jgi:hypothetical protein
LIKTSAPYAHIAARGCSLRASRNLFDHLVGDRQQIVRNFNAERSRGLKVDHELELRHLQNRQVSRLLAFEDATDIDVSSSKARAARSRCEYPLLA